MYYERCTFFLPQLTSSKAKVSSGSIRALFTDPGVGAYTVTCSLYQDQWQSQGTVWTVVDSGDLVVVSVTATPVAEAEAEEGGEEAEGGGEKEEQAFNVS